MAVLLVARQAQLVVDKLAPLGDCVVVGVGREVPTMGQIQLSLLVLADQEAEEQYLQAAPAEVAVVRVHLLQADHLRLNQAAVAVVTTLVEAPVVPKEVVDRLLGQQDPLAQGDYLY